MWRSVPIFVVFSNSSLAQATIPSSAPTAPRSPFPALLARAREVSLALQQGTANIDAARLKKELSDISALPIFSTSATLLQPLPIPTGSVANSTRNQVYAAQATGTLYDFGRAHARDTAAASRLKAQEVASVEAEIALAFSVARALAKVRNTAESLALEKEQAALTRERLELLDRNYREGMRPEEDVLLARIALGKSDLAVARQAGDLLRAENDLNDVAGPGAAESISQWIAACAPDPTPRAGEPPPKGPFPGPLQVARFEALLNSWKEFAETPAEKRRALEREAIAADNRMLAADRLPSLAGNAVAQFAGPWRGSLRPGATLQLQLTWEIPWAGKDAIARRTNEVTLRQSTLTDTEEKKSRLESLQDAKAQFVQAKETWERGRGQILLSIKYRSMLLKRYNAGRATAFELGSADTDFLGIRQDLLAQRQAMLTALIAAAEARGRTDLAEVFE